MTDDDYTRIVSLEICTEDELSGLAPKEHFRGFRAGIFSPTSGLTYHDFGTMHSGDPFEKCEGADISIDEELMYVSIYSDINDAEGIIFESWKGTEYVYRANG